MTFTVPFALRERWPILAFGLVLLAFVALFLLGYRPNDWVLDAAVLILGSAVAYLSARLFIDHGEADRDRFFSLSLDMLCIASTDGYFKRVSPAFTRTLGWSVEELQTRPFMSFVHPDDHVSTLREVERQVVAGETVLQFENRYLHKDGSWRLLSWMSTAQPGGMMYSTARDITEAKRLANTLAEKTSELENANRAKDGFLSTMSHELRTPLNGILGFSEFLVDEKPGKLNDKQKEYLNDILNSGRHLLQLINDVLDLSKVEAGLMELYPEPFTPSKAIEEVCSVIAPLAMKKGITIRTTVAPEIVLVTLDQQKFKQVLYNLLSNAVKFTDDGGSVDVVASTQESNRLRLQVRDTGIGIKPEDFDKLFVEFKQIDSGIARRYEGTGLGLALTKKIVEFQDGAISVQSESGKGSTFTVVLPSRMEATMAA